MQNPLNPGVFVPVWDQGTVNIGNGNSDGSWVHDDIRATAVAMEREGKRVIFVTSNTYMFLKADVDEMTSRIQAALPVGWKEADVLISSSHNHHGPETAFGPNPKWFEMAAGQIVKAAVAAAASAEPASASVANGKHNYGSVDQREPDIYDTSLNVLSFKSTATGKSIATMVQWNSHPEVTLGWTPPADAALAAACATKGWTGSKCTAKDRYFTGDFVGVLEARLKAARGGEVAYFNGALGVLTGPLHASTWLVDKDHPVGDGKTVPAGAVPLATCAKANQYECPSFAKTESTGHELANAVNALLDNARPLPFKTITVRKQEFYSRATNLGFRALIAQGQLGWKPMQTYNCTGKPFTDANCVNAGLATVSDPVLTAAMGAPASVSKGDVLKTRVMHVSFGDVGMLFVPGEVPSELVVGLPGDFKTAPDTKYFHGAANDHAVGDKYVIPGHYLSLVDEPLTFVVGLGTDELGYFVPSSDYRLQCHALSLSVVPGATCADLAARGVIESASWVGGLTCQRAFDDPAFLATSPRDAQAVKAICYYGQFVGSAIAKPSGHYEETNAAGWDLVDDLWAAAVKLFAKK